MIVVVVVTATETGKDEEEDTAAAAASEGEVDACVEAGPLESALSLFEVAAVDKR